MHSRPLSDGNCASYVCLSVCLSDFSVWLHSLLSNHSPPFLTNLELSVFLSFFLSFSLPLSSRYSTGTYAILPYFFSKLFFELPLAFAQAAVQWGLVYLMIQFRASYLSLMFTGFILGSAASSVAVLLGCAVADIKTATEMLPLVFVPQLLFAGFFIRTDQIPAVIRWAEYLCSLKYAMNLMILIEFDSEVCDDSDENLEKCSDLLEANGADEDSFWTYALILIGLFLAFRVAGAYLLTIKAKTVF